MTVEEWLPIPGFEGRYDVSDQGRVRSWLPWRGTPVPRVLDPGCNSKGYLHVSLCSDGRPISYKVHRLVMLAFVGPRPDGLQTRHVDSNQLNNRLSNLLYGTGSENVLDAVAHGTWANNNGNLAKTHCPQNHPYDAENTYVDPRRRDRHCRECNRHRNGTRAPAASRVARNRA